MNARLKVLEQEDKRFKEIELEEQKQANKKNNDLH
jgi:hypothetical protein